MRRVSALVATVATIGFVLTATPARAGAFVFNGTDTYTYTGDVFNVCGYGCPEHAPADPTGVDYIIAVLKFAGPLAPNLVDVSPATTFWSMTDFFGSFFFSGAGVMPGIPADVEEPAFPGLVLSTDGTGKIVKWIMTAGEGTHTPDGYGSGTQAAIINPPIACGEECGGAGMGITDFLVVDLRSDPDTEWDAGVVARVAPVPEPASLTLFGLGLGVAARRRLHSRRK
jgi:hypothetical protein